MAIWQWDVWIVPRKGVKSIYPVIPDYMDLDWFESVDWWDSVSEAELRQFFDTVLPVFETPWAKYSTSWGSLDENRIQIMVEDGKVTDVVIRVDLRDLNLDLLNSLVNFSEDNDFLFYSLESNRFIEPDLQELLSEIRKSRKITFLQSSEKFFEDKGYLNKINKENQRKIDKGI